MVDTHRFEVNDINFHVNIVAGGQFMPELQRFDSTNGSEQRLNKIIYFYLFLVAQQLYRPSCVFFCFFCPILDMNIQGLLKLNQTKLIFTRLN